MGDYFFALTMLLGHKSLQKCWRQSSFLLNGAKFVSDVHLWDEFGCSASSEEIWQIFQIISLLSHKCTFLTNVAPLKKGNKYADFLAVCAAFISSEVYTALTSLTAI